MPAAPLIENEPADMTPAEHEKCVAWLKTLPLAELRRRQGLVETQTALAFAQWQRGYDKAGAERAMENLNAMGDDLFSAIYRQTFLDNHARI